MTTQIVKAPVEIIASQPLAAGAYVRGTVDNRGKWGGQGTVRITNGVTGPTAACVVKLLVAHTDQATPAAGAQGADWKLRHIICDGGLQANAVTEVPFSVPFGVNHFEIEFGGHAGQGVTVEALFTHVTSITP